MADTKISELTDGGGLLASDEIAINRGGVSDKAKAAGVDGWVAADAMTYASGSGGGVATMTCSGDQTSKYKVGTFFKLNQTTDKYFVVTASSFSSGTTTVTIFAGTDYTLANAAITSPYYSYAANPVGWPGWFNYSVSAATGFTGALTVVQARFAVVGRTCTVSIDFAGTSNATTFTFPAPITASGRTLLPCIVLDSGNPAAGRADLPDASATITMGKAITGAGGFTNSGSKGVFLYLTYLF